MAAQRAIKPWWQRILQRADEAGQNLAVKHFVEYEVG
jgi:hypothetical protein